MDKILQKLTSRKLWLALAGVVTGIAVILGVDGGEITTVAGAVVSLFSVVTYIITEGKIDAEGVKKAVIDTQEAITTIEGADEQ